VKAMVLREPAPIGEGPLVASEVPEPDPEPGEIRIKVRACGICHTDLHIIEGDLPPARSPVIPGHQVIGVVDGLGEGVTRFQIGDRVGVPWVYRTCGECAFCKRGEENLCPEARFTGYHVDGGYAEYAVAPAAFAHPIPSPFGDAEAAPLLCAGIIGYRALRVSGIEPGGRLGLYGFGASAHLAIQVALYWGCQVYVFSRGEEHRRLARDLGAAWTGQAEQEPPVKLDASIIFAPAGWLVPLALRHLRPGGTLALAGITMSPIPEMDYALLYGERTVRSVANATRRDAEEFLSLAAAIPVRVRVQTFALTEANRALQLLKRGQINGAGVLMVWG